MTLQQVQAGVQVTLLRLGPGPQKTHGASAVCGGEEAAVSDLLQTRVLEQAVIHTAEA